MDKDARLILKHCCDHDTLFKMYQNCKNFHDLMSKTWESKPKSKIPNWAVKQIEEAKHIKSLLEKYMAESGFLKK